MKSNLTKKRPANIEWLGVVITAPAYITGEGEPYRPEMLFWIGADGLVLGVTAVHPDELGRTVCESLAETIRKPMAGSPHAPTHIRTSSPDVAAALRAGHPSIQVVHGPTPEADALAADLMDRMEAAAQQQDPTYLSPGVSPEAVASFFRAAAGLYRAKPWKVVPGDQSVFSVTIESLGLEGAALSVIGQMGESFGFVLFAGLEDFEAYCDAAEAFESGERPSIPMHLTVGFERRADLEPALRNEIAEHGWEVAGAAAYPWVSVIDEDLVARPPTAEELTTLEAIALALPQVLEEKKALRLAWKHGERFERTVTVRTCAHPLDVTFAAPYEQAEQDPRHASEVLADLGALSARDDLDDQEEARAALERELLARFARSPEAHPLGGLWSCETVMDYAGGYLGVTIASLEPAGLREIVFQIIPRKVSTEASSAGGIIGELRAFYAFLKREGGLAQADACLRVLGGNADKKLEAALSDPRNFGLAKSMFMRGLNEGFDVRSPEGLDEWMRNLQLQSLADEMGMGSALSPRSPTDKASSQARKQKRKAARKSRKKNKQKK
jgi:hypothetical protein